MKIQESAENYLEAILTLSRKNGSVRSVDIAAELEFSKPSVSVAMRNLRLSGCIEMDADGFISLTDKGRQLAEGVFERHTLISQCLIALGVNEATALEDACRIEHVISPEVLAPIRILPGHSQTWSRRYTFAAPGDASRKRMK